MTVWICPVAFWGEGLVSHRNAMTVESLGQNKTRGHPGWERMPYKDVDDNNKASMADYKSQGPEMPQCGLPAGHQEQFVGAVGEERHR